MFGDYCGDSTEAQSLSKRLQDQRDAVVNSKRTSQCHCGNRGRKPRGISGPPMKREIPEMLEDFSAQEDYEILVSPKCITEIRVVRAKRSADSFPWS